MVLLTLIFKFFAFQLFIIIDDSTDISTFFAVRSREKAALKTIYDDVFKLLAINVEVIDRQFNLVCQCRIGNCPIVGAE